MDTAGGTGPAKYWGDRRGSNPRHLGPQPSALPAELRPPWSDNCTVLSWG